MTRKLVTEKKERAGRREGRGREQQASKQPRLGGRPAHCGTNEGVGGLGARAASGELKREFPNGGGPGGPGGGVSSAAAAACGARTCVLVRKRA